MASVNDFRGLLQIAEVQLDSMSSSVKVFALRDSDCIHYWIPTSKGLSNQGNRTWDKLPATGRHGNS